jgi:hypothetical protein
MGRAWISATRTVDNTTRRCEISIAKHCRDEIFFTIYYLLFNLITSQKFDRQNVQICARDMHARPYPFHMPRRPGHAHVVPTSPRNTRETLFFSARAQKTKLNIVHVQYYISVIKLIF